MRILENLLMIRQNVIKMYKQYDYIAGPILKFIMIYIIINMFISKISYEGAFTNPVLVLFISLIGVVLNDKGILLGTVVLVPLYVLTLNPILAAILFIFLIVIYILFMRLFPKEVCLLL